MPCTISISLTPNTRHQERKQRMRVARFSFLLISYCFTLLNISEAGQGEQLRRLIRSKRSSWPPQSNPWPTLDATEAASRVYVSPQDGLMQADKIRALPRQPKCVDFDQYAGYVTVNEEKGRALFYYFVESPHNSSRKPLVLWLNGGPGCSSLGYGAMQELGPFRVKSDGKTLERNQYAWNNVANVLFLESPAGVGFSYSNTTSDYNLSGDKRTAKDSYTFLINWLERFPQYKHREFYITGESYGGHYVPQLALLILRRNKLANHTLINLKGIAIGNAYVDDGTNEKGTYEHLWSHAVISDETLATIRKACNFSGEESEECIKATDIAGTEAGRIDYYNIYAPICLGTNSSSKSGVAMADVDPCSDSYVTTYLNSPDVQKALHANVTKIDGPWEGCSDLPWSDAPTSTLSTIKTLINGGLRVWLYSGDTDSVCPYRATSDEIRMLKLPIKNSWRAWYSNNEVGGYVVGYEGLTFVTVRGAGHMVPTYQPERAITMLSSFLHGKLPPAS